MTNDSNTQHNNSGTPFRILKDGTKIRPIPYDPEYPESIDVKVTNNCDKGCTWCSERSEPNGITEFNTDKAINLFKDLPEQTELAIGGGNVLTCERSVNTLIKSLPQCICNVTVNQDHSYCAYKINANAFGISVYKQIKNLPCLPNRVIHLIAGINTLDDLEFYLKYYPRVLVLGYKFKGRGVSLDVSSSLKQWQIHIGQYLTTDSVLAFDELALQQLDLKRFFTPEQWDELYMTENYSMYIDLVMDMYARSSNDLRRYQIGKLTVKEMFNHLKKS